MPIAAAVAAAILSGSTSTAGAAGAGYPNLDPSSSRHASGVIDSETAARLKPAWSQPLTKEGRFGRYASTPVVADGVVYSQDLASNVTAIDLASGEALWARNFESPSIGPNGLMVAGDAVFGATVTSAFALDRKTGAQLWSIELVNSTREGIDMAPGYSEGRVYVSTVPIGSGGAYRGGAIGTLWALDATSGAKLWSFDTVPPSLWGNAAANSGGGLWYTPSFDDKGFMYFGVGNPAPFPGTSEFPWGSSRPGPNLYTNSLVKLDALTGELEWYYQQTPHDIYDWDFQDPPILADAGGRQMAIGAGKSGVVVALDRSTGALIWKRPVGIHNGHDDDPLYAMEGEYERLETSVPVFPGQLGGVIAPMATNGSALFVPVVNSPLSISPEGKLEQSATMSGEVVALDLASGAVKWKRELPSPAFGAVTAVNDLVFATTFAGEVHALDATDGTTVWSAELPAGTNAGVTVAGATVIAPAGVAGPGQDPRIVAFRLDEAPHGSAGDVARAPMTQAHLSAATSGQLTTPPPAGVAEAARVASVKRGTALLRMRCRGQRPCSGLVRLTRKPLRPGRSTLIGRSRFQISPRHGRFIPVRLSRRIAPLLRRASGRLPRVALTGHGVRARALRLWRSPLFIAKGRVVR